VAKVARSSIWERFDAAQGDATPMIAVTDIDRAKDFYSSKLGLEPSREMGDEFFMLRSGNTTVNVYRSEFAGTNKAR